jgi:hypothetical protein
MVRFANFLTRCWSVHNKQSVRPIVICSWQARLHGTHDSREHLGLEEEAGTRAFPLKLRGESRCLAEGHVSGSYAWVRTTLSTTKLCIFPYLVCVGVTRK